MSAFREAPPFPSEAAPGEHRSDADELHRCELRAWERFLSDHYGGDGPLSLEEQQRAAWEHKQ